MIFYISDTHFGHENIIKLCNRPFNNVEEMDEVLIENWNSRVTKEDDVYHLGDFSYKIQHPVEYIEKLIFRNLFLIKGNHDKSKNFLGIKDNVHFLPSYYELSDCGKQLVLCHYPIENWNGMNHDSIHLFGHTHDKAVQPKVNRFSVCVEVINYLPVTLKDLRVV